MAMVFVRSVGRWFVLYFVFFSSFFLCFSFSFFDYFVLPSIPFGCIGMRENISESNGVFVSSRLLFSVIILIQFILIVLCVCRWRFTFMGLKHCWRPLRPWYRNGMERCQLLGRVNYIMPMNYDTERFAEINWDVMRRDTTPDGHDSCNRWYQQMPEIHWKHSWRSNFTNILNCSRMGMANGLNLRRTTQHTDPP